MRLQEEIAEGRRQFALLTFYEKFEHIVILALTALIAIFIVFAVWNLALKIVQAVGTSTLDPTDYSVFQAVFGAIFTVIIALEFKRSLLVAAERQQSVVQVRTVILIALLAIVRKLLILDVGHAPLELFALAAAIIALGVVYWLVRDQDRSIAGEGFARIGQSAVPALRKRPERVEARLRKGAPHAS
jgi:uncharacterized membrane protein (DUF373 family)